MRYLRRNGDGIDPERGVEAHELGAARLGDGGVRISLRNERGRVLASIDYDATDVRAFRDSLSTVLRVMEA